MPPYRARPGGVFGSGLYPDSRPQIDVGGAIDAITRGATTTIENAFQRRRLTEQRQVEKEERERAHRREDVLDQRSADEFRMKQEEHAAQMAASGYTPAHDETRSTVEPGSVESNGLFGKPGSVKAPSVKTKTSRIAGAYDFRKSAAYQIATDARGRKALEFSAVYKKNFPNATDAEAMQAGQYAADNPSIADNILFPPRPRAAAGSANSPIGKALTTAGARVRRNQTDRARVHSEVTRRFPGGLSDAGNAADTSDYRRLNSQDSTLDVEGKKLRAVQDSLADRQMRESGLTPTTDSAPPPKKTKANTNPHAAEESRLAKLANSAIAAGADPEAVNKRLKEQLRKLRAK